MSPGRQCSVRGGGLPEGGAVGGNADGCQLFSVEAARFVGSGGGDHNHADTSL